MSICCKDLPHNPKSLYGVKAESGCVKVENLRHEVLIVEKRDDNSLIVKWTHSRQPMLVDFQKQRVHIQIRKDSIAFWDDSYPEFARGIRNVPHHWRYQIEEVKRLLDMMKVKYTAM